MNGRLNKRQKNVRITDNIADIVSDPCLSPLTYRWIGKGEKAQNGSIHYNQVEVKIDGHGCFIKVGDNVFLSNNNSEVNKLFPFKEIIINDHNKKKMGTPRNVKCVQPLNNTSHRKESNYLTTNNEIEKIYDIDKDYKNNDSSLLFSDAGINAEDPFVAQIEDMWEDPPLNERIESSRHCVVNGDIDRVHYFDERRTRMKLRARWFFKRDDIACLCGKFEGVSRSHLLSVMTTRDLLLGEQRDDNEISTIIGKCEVICQKPSMKTVSATSNYVVNESYICQYNISIQDNSKVSCLGSIVITPFSGSNDYDNDSCGNMCREQGIKQDKKDSRVRGVVQTTSVVEIYKRMNKDDKKISKKMMLTNFCLNGSPSTTYNYGRSSYLFESRTNEDNQINMEEIRYDDSNKRYAKKYPSNMLSSEDECPVSIDCKPVDILYQEISTKSRTTVRNEIQGKINIGLNYQASIPPIVNKKTYVSRRFSNPICVWSHGNLSDTKLDSYLNNTSHILEKYMLDEFGLENERRKVTFVMDGGLKGTCLPRSEECNLSRESNLDSILGLLHDQSYNTTAALQIIEKIPESLLTLWNKEEKTLYNAGFKIHFTTLHMIGKVVGSSKSHKDVVDYHYRFKIPEQFKIYQEMKRSQARKIMECVENRRTKHIIQLRNEGGHCSGPKKTRLWSHCVGASPNTMSEVEKRCFIAKDLLFYIREVVGPEKYFVFVNNLKGYKSQSLSMSELKDCINDILKDYPVLLKRFLHFFP